MPKKTCIQRNTACRNWVPPKSPKTDPKAPIMTSAKIKLTITVLRKFDSSPAIVSLQTLET